MRDAVVFSTSSELRSSLEIEVSIGYELAPAGPLALAHVGAVTSDFLVKFQLVTVSRASADDLVTAESHLNSDLLSRQAFTYQPF